MLVRGIFTEISGALGGVVGSRNRGGLYLRARAVPVNPNTPFQVEVRTIFGQLNGLWGSLLTDIQRAAWEVYAENVSVVNRIGETIFLTGKGHYVRANTARVQAGLPRVDDGPADFSLGDFGATTIAIVGGTSVVDVAFEDTDAWVDEDGAAMIVLAGRSVSQTINFFKGPFQFADNILGDGLLPPTSPAPITSNFAYLTGQRAFAQVRVSRADGRLSQTAILEADVS